MFAVAGSDPGYVELFSVTAHYRDLKLIGHFKSGPPASNTAT